MKPAFEHSEASRSNSLENSWIEIIWFSFMKLSAFWTSKFVFFSIKDLYKVLNSLERDSKLIFWASDYFSSSSAFQSTKSGETVLIGSSKSFSSS